MTDTERQAVRRAALLDAALEIEARITPAHQGGGVAIEARNAAYRDAAARIRAIADRSVVLTLADKPGEPEKCRHNTVATRCTECRALGKTVSLK